MSTLWVDPVDEWSPSVSAADTFTFTGNLNSYALRQGISVTGAPGQLTVDNLLVGTSFADVVPVPEPSTIALLGLSGIVLGFRALRKRT